jgi:hypothetical protein
MAGRGDIIRAGELVHLDIETEPVTIHVDGDSLLQNSEHRHAGQHKGGMIMISLCDHCEYGNRFIDLGQCPECETGRIVGDLHTRDIFCSNLHKITAVAISFCGRQNCHTGDAVFRNYEIIITSKLSYDQLIAVGNMVEKTPVQIYKAIKAHTSFCDQVYFFPMLKLGKFLHERNISFHTVPEIPILYEFVDCFPGLADDYSWVLEMDQK